MGRVKNSFFKPTEELLKDLMQAKCEETHQNPELRLFWTEEWTKMYPNWCVEPINGDQRCLVEVIEHGGHTMIVRIHVLLRLTKRFYWITASIKEKIMCVKMAM